MLNLPTTTREQILRMREQGANENWVRMLAVESGVDYDEDTKDEFINNNNQDDKSN